MRRIDSHHHFWRYSPSDYPWISESMSVLRGDYMPQHLLAETRLAKIDGVISVQARQSVEESTWLLAQAVNQDWILGVVGWLPLANPSIHEQMEDLRYEEKLCGLRHVVQDEVDDAFLVRPEFNQGIRAMKEFGWTYDLLIYARQLPLAIPFVDQHPDQVFVLDHIAKPTIESEIVDESWVRGLRELAKRPNVYCKFSGVVTEVRGADWSLSQIEPYWDIAIEAFGSNRLMFGTDWPVCLLKTSYSAWVTAVETFASQLSQSEQAKFWSDNAVAAYRLELASR